MFDLPDRPLKDGEIVWSNPALGEWMEFHQISDTHGVIVKKRDPNIALAIKDYVAEERALLAGTRFRDGLTKVASVPQNVVEDQLWEPLANYDTKYVNKWLNENPVWRIKEGKL